MRGKGRPHSAGARKHGDLAALADRQHGVVSIRQLLGPLGWPEQRLVVELDVYETHGTRAAFERDRLRQEDLLLDEIRMTRVTGPRLAGEPQRVIARVARLLAQGERRP